MNENPTNVLDEARTLAAQIDLRTANLRGLIAASDDTLPPAARAARRKKIADKKQADEDRLFATPTPSYEAYVAIAKRLNFETPKELFELITSLKLEWVASYKVAVDHQHDKVRAAHRIHELEIQDASENPEKLRGLTVRNFEDFQNEFLSKLKAANKRCAAIAGKINVLVAPIRTQFADAVETLASKLESDEEAICNSLELEYQASYTVMQLRRAVLDIRNSTAQISPKPEDELTGIADLVAKKVIVKMGAKNIAANENSPEEAAANKKEADALAAKNIAAHKEATLLMDKRRAALGVKKSVKADSDVEMPETSQAQDL